jgi:hypothetical protein
MCQMIFCTRPPKVRLSLYQVKEADGLRLLLPAWTRSLCDTCFGRMRGDFNLWTGQDLPFHGRLTVEVYNDDDQADLIECAVEYLEGITHN